jgi:hypothetical protein
MSRHRTFVAEDGEILGGIGRRDRRATARFQPEAVRGLRSLRWICSLLPGEEGMAWWPEVTSCLAETPDPGPRRRYVRSYRRSVSQLVWSRWTLEQVDIPTSPRSPGAGGY